MRRCRKKVGTLALCLAVLAAGAASAGTIAFDSITGSTPVTTGGTGFTVGNEPISPGTDYITEAAQQFTSAASGSITQLTASIENQPFLFNSSTPNPDPNTITVGVFTNSTNTLGSLLGELQLTTTPGTSQYGYATGSFASSGISLTSGLSYWVATLETNTVATQWNYVQPRLQSGLTAYVDNNRGDISAAAFNNAIFQPTGEELGLTVEVNAVPLPSAIWLLLCGLAGLAALAKSRVLTQVTNP